MSKDKILGTTVALTPEQQAAVATDQNKRRIEIIVINNAFIMKTRSGWYAYYNAGDLGRAVVDYAEVIKKETQK